MQLKDDNVATFMVNNMTIKEVHQKNKPMNWDPLTGSTVTFEYMYLFGLTLTF